MACNCGGTSPQPAIYRLHLPDGTVRDYFTYQEADAANKRAGGIGTISMVAR
ncbi:DUF7196 family protein [Streptomyces sp. NPDC001739]|uniref:DUF7196 family protein n=1 Tax=Streptomyces TaxID=1883 RepID=UPI003B63C5A6